jgi:hypothetical protein
MGDNNVRMQVIRESEIPRPDPDRFIDYWSHDVWDIWDNLFIAHSGEYLDAMVIKLIKSGYKFVHIDESYHVLGTEETTWIDVNGFLFDTPKDKLAFLLKWS